MKTTRILGILSFLLVFNATLFSQDNMPDWSVNPALFENSGSITGSVVIDDQAVGSEDDILAAFVGDEVRGMVNGIYFPPNDSYLFYLSVYSNVTAGETLTFKFYQLSSDTVFNLSETVEFTSNMFIGGPLTPFVFTNLNVDCAGVPGGGAYEDLCGVCDDDPSNDDISCSGCTDDTALNFDPDATIDDGSCEYPQGNEWVVNPSGFENNGSIVARILVNGVVDGSANDQIAAFVDGEIRGVTNGIYFSLNDIYLFPLTVYSNENSGEILTFQYYRASDDQIFDIDETLEFTSNMYFGSPVSPIDFHTGTSGQVDCMGVEGGSAYFDQCGICDDDPNNDNETCSGCTDPTANNFDPNAIVDDGSCSYTDNNWQINPAEFEFSGAVIAQVSVDGIDSGSSGDQLSAFVDGEIRGVTDAIFYPPGGYYVFMLTIYSNTVSGEVVTFQFLDSETGLVYTISETVNFSSNMIEGSVDSPLQFNGALYGPPWQVDPFQFENSGNMIAVIYMDGSLFSTETADKVAAFVDGEVRGVANGFYFPPGGDNVFMLTIYSNATSGETLSFQFWDSSTDEIYDIENQASFTSNMLLGNPGSPYELDIITVDCNGVIGGDWVIDDCEDCVDPADFNGAMDCA
ncbi:MAG: hypothetical protein ACE5D7_02775, partial [Fidelibacterota bacterium]